MISAAHRAPVVGRRSEAATQPGHDPSGRVRAHYDRDIGSSLLPQPVPEAEHYLGLARSIAKRFAGRGEEIDDLTQVANVGLLKAIRRFDGARGVRFSTFATITITGELKRHFRDTRWTMRVPRGQQERYLCVRDSLEELTQELGRSPVIAEIARRTGLSEEQVVQAQETAAALHVSSIDTALSGDNITASGDDDDRNYAAVEDRITLTVVLARLTPDCRSILHLRFVNELSHTEIADRLGISQLQVSRLLRRTIDECRRCAVSLESGRQLGRRAF